MTPSNEQPVVTSTEIVAPVVAQPPPENETPQQKYARLYEAPIATTSPELAQTIEGLRSDIQSLRQQPHAQQTAAPAQSGLQWVENIRQGKFEDAQNSLAEYVKAQLAPELEKARQEAYSNALNASQISMETDRYLTQVRNSNPELMQFERYLAAPVEERMKLAQSAGRIKNSGDFLREYKAAVDGEVTALRNISQQFRAAGKDEASRRQQDVLSSSPLTPQQVQSNQGPPSGSQSDSMQGEDTNAYFARRRADESRRRGLS